MVSLLEIILISVGLTMDVFAYALCKGAMMSEIRKKNLFKICSIFTIWQVISMILGNLLTNIPFIAKLGTYAGQKSNTFSVLIFLGLGIYMIVKAIREKPVEEKKEEVISAKQIVIWACITSVDAFIAGIGFGFLETDFLLLVLIIGIVTITLVIIGMYIGYWMGCQFRRTAVTIGGCILLFGGVELIIRTLY